jgi:hypothetical protein
MHKPRKYYASGDRDLTWHAYFNKYLDELDGKLGSFNTEFTKLSLDQRNTIVDDFDK